MVSNLAIKPYNERLRTLGLPTLEYRRLRNDMIQVYKIMHGVDNVDKDKLFSMSTYQTTRGHSLKLFKKRASTEIRRNVFGYRVVGWNSLSDNIVTAPSVNYLRAVLTSTGWAIPSSLQPHFIKLTPNNGGISINLRKQQEKDRRIY